MNSDVLVHYITTELDDLTDEMMRAQLHGYGPIYWKGQKRGRGETLVEILSLLEMKTEETVRQENLSRFEEREAARQAKARRDRGEAEPDPDPAN